jgi:hypothetical protein
MLLYYTPIPVLNPTEISELKTMLAQGNKLLYAAPSYPVRPDGSRYGDSLSEIFGEENAKNIVFLKNYPDQTKLRELAQRFNVELNPALKSDGQVLTWRFSRGKEEMMLIINKSATAAVNVELPQEYTDYFTQEKLSGQIRIAPGLFRLVKIQ